MSNDHPLGWVGVDDVRHTPRHAELIRRELARRERSMARPIGLRTVARAIAIIEDSQYSHRRAIQEPELQTFATAAFHRQCIEEYEQVLRLLRRVHEMVSHE